MARPRINEDDLIGRRFGRLVVVKYDHRDEHGIYYMCRCSCGNHIVARRDKLLTGYVKSCGCLRREGKINPNDIIGLKYGELKVMRLVIGPPTEYKYNCLCSCGKECIVSRRDLLSRRVKSCGHLKQQYLDKNNGRFPNNNKKKKDQ